MIYKFRMISGEDKAFLRDYEVDSTQSFLHFHKVIQKNLGYDPNLLASFFLTDEHWNKGLEFTLIDMENDGGPAAVPMDSVRICDIIRAKKERLLYVYDLFTESAFFFELMDVFKPVIGVEYPKCTASVGEPPVQSSIESPIYISESEESFMDDIYKEFESNELDSSLDELGGDFDEK